MKIADLDKFFHDLDPDLRRRGTCDGLKFGEPGSVVRGVVTAHVPTVQVIRLAAQLECNTIITHEPVFYTGDGEAPRDRVSLHKLSLLQEHQLAVYRLHDLWDTFETHGVLDSWAAQLGLGPAAQASGRYKVYDVPTQSLLEFSRRVKDMMRLASVRVAGDVQNSVSRVGLGPGEHGHVADLDASMAMGANCFVAGESSEWLAARYAVDAGISMIVTGHTESENPGMLNLAKYLKQHFDGLKVEFLDAGNVYSYL